jgi:hypothetical protein
MKRDAGAFGGYAAGLGGEYRFSSGFYLKADVQRISSLLEFNNLTLLLNTPDSINIGVNQASGSTRSKEYRISYGVGVSTNWQKIRFALDISHSIEFIQRAESVADHADGFHPDGGFVAISRYNETFTFGDHQWRLVNNAAHQLQVTGSIIIAFSPKVGLGIFYRTDLLNRWVELQTEGNMGQTDLVAIERLKARQAMTGVRLTYRL